MLYLKKEEKVKIFGFRFNLPLYLGIGIYLGSEPRYIQLPHGMVVKQLKKFSVNNVIIYENECIFKRIIDE